METNGFLEYYIMEREEQITKRIGDNINDFGDRIQETIKPISQSVNDGVETFNEKFSNIKNTVKDNVENTLSEFSSKSAVNAGNDFLNSNSIIAKFAFVILVLILFVFLFNLGVKLISYFTSPETSPYIVKGLINGTNGMIISQNPNSSSSITLQRSNNNKSGIEFTWSVWLYISGVGSGTTTYSHVFNKGNGSWDTSTGLATVNNSPGLYLKKDIDGIMSLYLVMDTENIQEDTKRSLNISVTNVPIQKWFNVCIRMENIIMDVYINGTNSGRLTLPYVPRQNYNDINVCQNNGFDGKLSNLRYFDYALSVYEINTLIWQGPNLTQNSKAAPNYGTTYSNGINYMSNLWYTSKINTS